MDQSLYLEIQVPQPYWIVSGPGTCGKTTVAKFLTAEFGYKYIDYEAECASLKEKIATPEDGDEVPARKYIDYFAKLLQANTGTVYVFDGIAYEGKNLADWVACLGSPHLINLKVDADEQIKRARKKAEGDLAAEVSEEETAKATEATQKNEQWIESLC